jgi:cytosine/adenosine deaminase-related metal-dependent hydrolase
VCAARHQPTLSCDIVSLNSGDLFAQMRLGLAYERFRRNDVVNQAGGMPATLAPSARDALAWATVNGADACGSSRSPARSARQAGRRHRRRRWVAREPAAPGPGG